MARFVYYTATTLNGYLADDDDSLEWLFAVPGAAEAESGMAEFFDTIGAMVMGATTYAWILEHDTDSWAQTYGARPCFVVTHRTFPVPAGSDIRFVAGDVAEWVNAAAAAAADRDVWLVGGGDLVGQFADIGRLDEVRVSIAPVLLTSGRPLLPRRIESDRLTLTAAAQAGQFAELSYRVSS